MKKIKLLVGCFLCTAGIGMAENFRSAFANPPLGNSLKTAGHVDTNPGVTTGLANNREPFNGFGALVPDDRLAREFWQRTAQRESIRREARTQLLLQAGKPLEALQSLGLKSPDGGPEPSLEVRVRQINGELFYYVFNRALRPFRAPVRFHANSEQPEFWDPETGAIIPCPVFHSRGHQEEILLDLAARQTRFVVFPNQATREINTLAEAATQPPGAVTFRRREGKTLAVFHEPATLTYRLAAGGAILHTNTVRASAFLPALDLSRGWRATFTGATAPKTPCWFDMAASCFARTNAPTPVFAGRGHYQKKFTLPPGALPLARLWYLDIGEVRELATLEVNGRFGGCLPAFPSAREISAALHEGENTITIHGWHPEGQPQPVGLLGPVTLRPAWLVPLVHAEQPPCPVRAENLLKNPDFEATDAQGATCDWNEKKPVYTFANGVGRHGSRGLAFQNDNPEFYSFPSQRINLQPGAYYQFGGWVRTEDLRGEESGASFCIEWSDANGKWLGGAYATRGIKGTSAGWQRISDSTQRIPEQAARFTFAPYVRKGMTGRAWFDSLEVTRLNPPPVQNVAVSTYRHLAAKGPVSFYAALMLKNLPGPTNQLRACFNFVKAGGTWRHSTRPDTLDAHSARLTRDASFFPPGDYTVTFQLNDAANHRLGEAHTVFTRATELPPRRVFIDEHLRLIDQGQPFFPLGMYWSNVETNWLKRYREAPFNCLLSYQMLSRAQLDLCQTNGLKVIYSLKDLYVDTKGAPHGIRTQEDEEAEIERRVTQFKDHPALIAWYLNDELPLAMLDRLAAHQTLLEKLDPDHPTWIVLYQYRDVRRYLPTFDVIGTDPYPIPTKPASDALTWTRTVREQTYGARANWQVPQVFSWGSYHPHDPPEKSRPPTLEEMRSMAWQCIAGGANGLIFYSFYDLFKPQNRATAEKRWNEVRDMTEEIRHFIPVLLSVEPAPVASGMPENVAVRTWRLGRSVYVLAVNSSNRPQKAVLKFNAPIGRISIEFGHLPQLTHGHELTFTFEPLEPILCRMD